MRDNDPGDAVDDFMEIVPTAAAPDAKQRRLRRDVGRVSLAACDGRLPRRRYRSYATRL
jgi:hypothetical protein